jgi:beta-phosphoglucomutase-like phosphatase (HAD superfamily)
MSSTLRALIFDVDGTLAETERYGHRVAFNRAFAEVGLPWDWTEPLYGELLQIAGGKERICFYVQHYQPELPEIQDLEQWAATLHRTKIRHYQHLLREGLIQVRPGVRRLLLEAQQTQLRLTIATTSALPNVIALLETALGPEAPGWFEVIGAGDMVPHKKPAPDIYRYVLQQLQLTPEECLVLEDSEAGLTAAAAAHLTTVVTVNSYTEHQDFSQAKLVLNHLGEPDFPCHVLAGNLDGAYFDLASAQQIMLDRF